MKDGEKSADGVSAPSLSLLRHKVPEKWQILWRTVKLPLLLLFSHSVVSDFLWPHGLQHARRPCPSSSPRACSNSYPLSSWFHPTISSSVIPFSSCLQSFPASGSFQWVSSLHQVAKVLELQLQHQAIQWIFRIDFLRNDWLDLLVAQGTLKSLLQHHSSKASIL